MPGAGCGSITSITKIHPLLEEGKRFLQENGVGAPIETRVAEGKVSQEIIRLAQEGGYTGIVMGRRGLSPVKGLLLESADPPGLYYSSGPENDYFCPGRRNRL